MPKSLISGTATVPDWSFGFFGAVEHGANLYTLGTLQGAGTEAVGVFKSTDGGATWTEMDSANRKSLADQNRASASAFAFSDTFRVYHTDPTGDTLAVSDFNMATDTWGSTDVSAESIFGVLDTFGGIDGVRRSDGSDVIIFQAPDSGGVAVCKYVIRSGVGSWGSSVAIGSAFQNNVMVGLALGSSDRVHFIFREATASLYHKRLTAAGSLGSATFLDNLFSEGRPWGKPLVISGNLYVPYCLDYGVDHPQLAVSIGTDADTPSWSGDTPADDRVPGYAANSFSPFCMVDVGGVPWLVFVGYHNAQDFPNGIWVARRVSGVWTTPEEIVEPEALTAYEGISAGSLGTTVGIVFKAGSYYFAEGEVESSPASEVTYSRRAFFS